MDILHKRCKFKDFNVEKYEKGEKHFVENEEVNERKRNEPDRNYARKVSG